MGDRNGSARAAAASSASTSTPRSPGRRTTGWASPRPRSSRVSRYLARDLGPRGHPRQPDLRRPDRDPGRLRDPGLRASSPTAGRRRRRSAGTAPTRRGRRRRALPALRPLARDQRRDRPRRRRRSRGRRGLGRLCDARGRPPRLDLPVAYAAERYRKDRDGGVRHHADQHRGRAAAGGDGEPPAPLPAAGVQPPPLPGDGGSLQGDLRSRDDGRAPRLPLRLPRPAPHPRRPGAGGSRLPRVDRDRPVHLLRRGRAARGRRRHDRLRSILYQQMPGAVLVAGGVDADADAMYLAKSSR